MAFACTQAMQTSGMTPHPLHPGSGAAARVGLNRRRRPAARAPAAGTRSSAGAARRMRGQTGTEQPARPVLRGRGTLHDARPAAQALRGPPQDPRDAGAARRRRARDRPQRGLRRSRVRQRPPQQRRGQRQQQRRRGRARAAGRAAVPQRRVQLRARAAPSAAQAMARRAHRVGSARASLRRGESNALQLLWVGLQSQAHLTKCRWRRAELRSSGCWPALQALRGRAAGRARACASSAAIVAAFSAS